MGWSATGNDYTILNSGLPNANITAYTTFHATLSDFSENADFIRLRIKDNNNNYADVNLVEGDNTIDLVALRGNTNCDFTNINDITLWGGNVPTEGHTIDGEHKASVVVTDVYMVKPDASFVSIKGEFGEEITSLAGITDGTKFVISDGTKAKYFKTSNENENANVDNVPSDPYFYFTLEAYDGGDIDNAYWIKITNADGEGYPRGTNGGTYLNAILNFNDAVISAVKEGWSNNGNEKKDALWYVTYNAENGFSFQNVYRSENSSKTWLSIGNYFESNQQYLKLYKSIEFTSTTMYPANDEVFSFENATGYDAETKTFSSNGGWTFATPVDISNYKYLYITTTQSGDLDHSVQVNISDENGWTIGGGDYKWEDSGIRGGCMYIDNWNHKNVLCVNVEYLAEGLNLDVEKIKSLTFNGAIKINNVVLSNYAGSEFIGREQYHTYSTGDHQRTYNATDLGKFGTVCLPYKAIAAGAYIYQIASASASGISLERVDGILEAGKPYFYQATDDRYLSSSVNKPNVQFFRVDFDNYDVPTPAVNNGLIGTFSEMTAPAGSNYYILSDNKLYNTEGCTGDYAVTVGANKAYINVDNVTSTVSGSRSAFILFDEATGINAVKDNVKADQVGIFNLNGQRLNQLKKGLNIVNGKKVMVK